MLSSRTVISQGSRDADEYWQLSTADGVTILYHGIWERVRESIGAGAGWLCQERVRQSMDSVRCADGWVGGLGVTCG